MTQSDIHSDIHSDIASQTGAKQDAIELNDSERQPCEVWTRVMGYHRPVSSFNIGKKGEYQDRKFFVEEKACPACGDR